MAAAVAIGGLSASAFTSLFVFLVPAVVALLFLATSFSEAARLAETLQAFLRRTAEVRAWGVALRVPSGATLTITSVKSFGAGLHVFLQVSSHGSTTHLKVAQPSRAQVFPQRLIIESAAYVQWAGRRLRPVTGAPALTIVVEPSHLEALHSEA
jgi:hypothetical protein